MASGIRPMFAGILVFWTGNHKQKLGMGLRIGQNMGWDSGPTLSLNCSGAVETRVSIQLSSVSQVIFFALVIVKYTEKGLDSTKHRFIELAWPFVISRFRCSLVFFFFSILSM